jgi:hypothetical protein
MCCIMLAYLIDWFRDGDSSDPESGMEKSRMYVLYYAVLFYWLIPFCKDPHQVDLDPTFHCEWVSLT